MSWSQLQFLHGDHLVLSNLWLLWSDAISVKILESCFYFIIAEIKLQPNEDSWILFCVYGNCEDRQNNHIWDRIIQYAQNPNKPLCAIGDFNCISDQQEKQGGSSLFKTKNRKFRAFIQQVGLVDLEYSGPAYT